MTWPSGALLRAIACLALAALVYASTPPPDALRTGLALCVLIGGLWMTQALHLSVTALLVPLLAVLTGLMDLRTALAPFAHPVIFLFLGGFALAAALQRHGLDSLLARSVLPSASTCWLTLPSSSASVADRPCLPTTTRSQSLSCSLSMMRSDGSPSTMQGSQSPGRRPQALAWACRRWLASARACCR